MKLEVVKNLPNYRTIMIGGAQIDDQYKQVLEEKRKIFSERVWILI